MFARVLTTITTIWRPGLSLSSYFWQSNYNWVVDRRNMPVEDLIRSQLPSEEEFTNLQEFADQRSSHFKLCIAINFKSLVKDLPQALTRRLAQALSRC